MDREAGHDYERSTWAGAYDDLPAVAPAVAALTLAAAGLTLVAAYWLLRSSRATSKRANFPAPAVHRRS